MLQITATDFKTNFGKYLTLAEQENILITKSGKSVVMLSGIKTDKVSDMKSLFGSVPYNGEAIDPKAYKAERLVKKYENLD